MIINKTKVTNLITLFFILTVLFGAFKPQAEAASAADFYKDKKITLIVAAKAGNSTDLIMRIIAPYLKKYTGAYAVVIDNNAEGAGMVALNRLWNSKPDGLTLSTNIPHATITMEVSKQEGVQFQCDKFNVIFAPSTSIGFALMVNAKGPFHSVDDLRKAKGLKSAGPYGKAVSSAYFADVLGLDAKVTPGMGTADSRLALMRGEIDFVPDDLSMALEGIESGVTRPLCVDGSTSWPLIPQAPPITKFASLSPQQKEWMKIAELTDSGKYVFAGPNVPKERIEYLRTVFERIHKDPQFLEDRKKFEQYPGSLPWLNGAEAQRMYTSYLNLAKGKEYSQMIEYLSKKYYTVK